MRSRLQSVTREQAPIITLFQRKLKHSFDFFWALPT
jgi:hypothetical protein